MQCHAAGGPVPLFRLFVASSCGRGGQCAVLLPLGKGRKMVMVYLVRKLPSRVAALLPSIAVSSSGVRPLVLRRWRDSDWSDQGLSVPKRMWSQPCVRTIWTNFSLERKLLSGVRFKTSAVSSHTFGVPISWSHTSSYIDQPPIWANTSLCGGTSFIILARRSTLASSQLGKLMSIPQWNRYNKVVVVCTFYYSKTSWVIYIGALEYRVKLIPGTPALARSLIIVL